MARPDPSPAPTPLWRTLLLGGLGCVAVGAVLMWLFSEGTPELAPEGMVVDEDGELVDARVQFEDDRALRREAALPRTSASMILKAFEGAGPGQAEISDVQTARDAFTNVMVEVESLAERPRAMRQRKWREVYRAANDSFSALSIHLDAKDPAQAKELEEAHKRLVTALSIVRVRGGKFKVH